MRDHGRVQLSCYLLFAVALNAQAPGTLAGRIIAEENSRALPGITVLAVRGNAHDAPTILHAVTDQEGKYTIDGASPGAYYLCVHARDYLDPCQWGAPALVSAGSIAPELRLQQGSRVVVLLDDPLRIAAGSDTARHGLAITAKLSDSSGKTRVLPLTRWSVGLYEYSDLAPAGTSFTVSVASGDFLLADASDSPINESGHTFPVVTAARSAPVAQLRPLRLPFMLTPSGGLPPTVVPVRIRGKRSP